MDNLALGEITAPPGKRQKLSPSTINVKLNYDGPALDSSLQACETTAAEHREAQLGILCYVNESDVGFTGIFKQRYTDFCVNEIDLKGTVTHLTRVEIPKTEPQNQLISNSETLGSADTDGFLEVDGAVASVLKPENVDSINTTPGPPDETTSIPDESEPQTIRKTNIVSEDEILSSNTVSNSYSSEDVALLDSYFGIIIQRSIIKLHEKVALHPNRKASSFGSVISQPIPDRQLRTEIHQNMRRIFQNVLETASDGNGAIKIYVSTAYNRSKGKKDVPRNQLKGQVGWRELGGQYLHFSLYKENKDTMEVVNFLSSRLKIPSKKFGIAGTKDRRAVTVQRISVPRIRAERLAILNNSLHNAKVGNFSYEKQGLQLGDLTGNEFEITLRNCLFHGAPGENEAENNKLDTAAVAMRTTLGNLQRNGFINYYGLQRFGTNRVGTQEVGKLILKGDHKGAIDAILAYPEEALLSSSDAKNGEVNDKFLPRDDIARARAVNIFQTTNNNKLALEMLPKKFSGEWHIMKHLLHNKKDLIGALTGIPRNLKLMYVHAYQSLVWNMAASKRWNMFGSAVVKGDLVIDDSANSKSSSDNNLVDEHGELIVLPDASDMAVTSDDLFQRARPLTKEEAASGKYNIFDIVLPTPGYDINYPDNEIGDYYKEFMESEGGGGLNPANMRRSHKDFSLSGSYRKLMAQIGNDVSFRVKIYSDENEQFVDTDLEKIQMKSKKYHEPLNLRAGDDVSDGQAQPSLTFNTTNNDEKKMAVIIKFQLGSSVYATMALREMMKRGGAKAFKPEFSSTR